MNIMNYDILTLRMTNNFSDDLTALSKESWPEFLLHADDHHWGELYTTFAEYQLLFVSEGELIGVGYTIPLYWNMKNETLPESIDDIIFVGIKCLEDKKSPNTLSALAAMIKRDYRNKRLSQEILESMKHLAREKNLN